VYTRPVRKIRDILYCRKQIYFSSECIEIVCRWAPLGPAGGAYSPPPDPLVPVDGPTSKRGEGKDGEEMKGKGGEDATHLLWKIPSYVTAVHVIRVSIVTDVRGVCLSVSLSVCRSRGSTRIHCAKMAGRINILFELNTPGCPRNIALDGRPDLPQREGVGVMENFAHCGPTTDISSMAQAENFRFCAYGGLFQS